jgi:hypothetical protein
VAKRPTNWLRAAARPSVNLVLAPRSTSLTTAKRQFGIKSQKQAIPLGAACFYSHANPMNRWIFSHAWIMK